VKVPSKVVQLTLNLERNTADWHRGHFQFRRTHAARFLATLWQNTTRGSHTQMREVTEVIGALNQSQKLGRQTMARLVAEMNDFFAAAPELGLSLHFDVRKATVGPWRLQVLKQLSVIAAPNADVRQINFFALSLSAQISSLRLLLSGWITFEGFAVYGEHEAALDALDSMLKLNALHISDEASLQLTLRRAYFLRRLSRYDQASDLLVDVLNYGQPTADARLASQALIASARIEYERDPAQRWRQAQSTMPNAPVLLAPCFSTLAEWHNLNALCARRAALEAFESGDSACGQLQHEIAIKHFQSAMYCVLSIQLWDRVHAYIDNFCYHLQKMLEHKVVVVDEVLSWYQLSLASADKLDSGNDDAWDLIYFAEFYLDHATELTANTLAQTHRSSLSDGRLAPQNPAFWQGAIARAKTIGGDRQIAITLTLYGRWLLEHHPQSEKEALTKTKSQLRVMLSLNPQLQQQLHDDGYEYWLNKMIAKESLSVAS
jgi:tetratricopeptide (TPR) repeat protein